MSADLGGSSRRALPRAWVGAAVSALLWGGTSAAGPPVSPLDLTQEEWTGRLQTHVAGELLLVNRGVEPVTVTAVRANRGVRLAPARALPLEVPAGAALPLFVARSPRAGSVTVKVAAQPRGATLVAWTDGAGEGLVRGSAGPPRMAVASDAVRLLTPVILGALDVAVVHEALAAVQGPLTTCWETAAGAGVASSYVVRAKVRISSLGHLESVELQAVHPADSALGDCVRQALEGASFPAPTGGGKVIASVAIELGPPPSVLR